MATKERTYRSAERSTDGGPGNAITRMVVSLSDATNTPITLAAAALAVDEIVVIDDILISVTDACVVDIKESASDVLIAKLAYSAACPPHQVTLRGFLAAPDPTAKVGIYAKRASGTGTAHLTVNSHVEPE